MLASLKKKIKDKVKKIWRYPLMRKMKKEGADCNVRILASNCIGGLLYHDIGKEFTSPTINLTIGGEDFIKLCNNPEYYLTCEPVFEKTSPQGYPVANLNGILIYGVHYKDFDDLKNQWMRRSRRFLEHSEQEILVMTCDSFLTSNELVEKFHSLPYRKVCYTKNPVCPYEEFVYVPGYESSDTIGDLTRYADYKGTRIFEKYFDCIKWLKNEK